MFGSSGGNSDLGNAVYLTNAFDPSVPACLVLFASSRRRRDDEDCNLRQTGGVGLRNNMNKADWTIQDAIRERVRQEDLAEWAQREVEPFEVVPFVVNQKRRSKLKVFVSIITP